MEITKNYVYVIIVIAVIVAIIVSLTLYQQIETSKQESTTTTTEKTQAVETTTTRNYTTTVTNTSSPIVEQPKCNLSIVEQYLLAVYFAGGSLAVYMQLSIENPCNDTVYITRVYLDKPEYTILANKTIDPGETLNYSGEALKFNITDPSEAKEAKNWESGTTHYIVIEYIVDNAEYSIKIETLVK